MSNFAIPINLNDMEKKLNPGTASVIIAVYNQFHWLQLILDALRQQTVEGFEVIIADDGSSPETVAHIREYIKAHPEMRIIHSWHDDQGWRKNKALNQAVRRAEGEYLIFVDGDCIPHPRFVEDHLRVRRRGTIFGGRRVDMLPSLSKMVESWPELPKGYFAKARRGLFRYFGETPFFNSLKQLRHTIHSPFLFGKPIAIKDGGFLGCNMGMYKADLESLNGFDERYVNPGTGEDTDLEARVRNAGMKCIKSARYALMLHRCHKRLPLDSEDNKRLLRETLENKTTYTPYGLVRR